MAKNNFKFDLKKWVNSEALQGLTKQLNGYEKKAKDLVRDFNLKGQEAKVKSKKKLDHFAKQLKKTRNDVEKKVTKVVNQETKHLNKKANDLFAYLKGLALYEEKKARSSSKGRKKSKTTKKRTKKTAKRKSVKTRAKGSKKKTRKETLTSVNASVPAGGVKVVVEPEGTTPTPSI